MDQRAIGFFDSGVGGLTSVPYLMKRLPNERIVYFGDTARTPYGSKAPDTIKTFSLQIADFLAKQDVKMIGIVCNTVSATCLPELRERFPKIPIIGVVEPAAKRIARVCTLDNRVGLIGTKVTVRSGVYEKLIGELNPDVRVFSCACPALVPLIEEGIIASDIMDLTIRYYIEDFILENRIDTLVLGCTHYPLVEDNIRRMFPDLRIINPSKEIVYAIEDELKKRDMLAGDIDFASENEAAEGGHHQNGSNHQEGSSCQNGGHYKRNEDGPKNTFYASDLSDNFRAMIDRICANEAVDIQFKSMEL